MCKSAGHASLVTSGHLKPTHTEVKGEDSLQNWFLSQAHSSLKPESHLTPNQIREQALPFQNSLNCLICISSLVHCVSASVIL